MGQPVPGNNAASAASSYGEAAVGVMETPSQCQEWPASLFWRRHVYSSLGKLQTNISLACNFPCKGQTTEREERVLVRIHLFPLGPLLTISFSSGKLPFQFTKLTSGFLPLLQAMVYSKHRTGSVLNVSLWLKRTPFLFMTLNIFGASWNAWEGLLQSISCRMFSILSPPHSGEGHSP